MFTSLSKKKRILLVEDDKPIMEVMSTLLTTEGYTVECASNGLIAIEKLRGSEELPNLILLDLMMPVMDGFRLRELQEQEPRLAEIPVVIMTADFHGDSKRIKIGAKDCLKKPLDLNSVLETVERYCS